MFNISQNIVQIWRDILSMFWQITCLQKQSRPAIRPKSDNSEKAAWTCKTTVFAQKSSKNTSFLAAKPVFQMAARGIRPCTELWPKSDNSEKAAWTCKTTVFAQKSPKNTSLLAAKPVFQMAARGIRPCPELWPAPALVPQRPRIIPNWTVLSYFEC